jgi:hypothetical protein
VSNRKPEQDLIDAFIVALNNENDPEIKVRELINSKCRAKKFADIEYVSDSGLRWVIEAKSNDSSDAHNTVHKIFGELLKETGRENRDNSRFAVLIPESGVSFYSRLFQSICRVRFMGFGDLIPVHSVITYGCSGIRRISWQELYDHYQP